MEKVSKLGQMGDIVNVKDGFARNYLLPQKKALRANTENIKIFEEKKAKLEIDNLEQKKDANKISDKMKNLSVIIIRQASESGQLYGSVTSRDIAKSIEDEGYKISKKQIILNKTIKQIGIYKIQVFLHPEVIKTININVARSSEEAKSQLENTLIDDTKKNNNELLEETDENLSVSEDFFENKELAENARESMKTNDEDQEKANENLSSEDNKIIE